MRILALLLASFFAAGANGKPILTAVCELPVGSRFDQTDGKVQQSKDNLIDAYPAFIVDDADPSKLLIVFSPTKPVGIPTGAERATILTNSARLLTAVLTRPNIGLNHNDTVEMYSLFPEKGLMFYTKHIYLPLGGGIPSSVTFYSSCQFAR
jgi:hypothetical protein